MDKRVVILFLACLSVAAQTGDDWGDWNPLSYWNSYSFMPDIQDFYIPEIPNIEVPYNCDVANASCILRCGSTKNMNFQCSDENGIVSSCSCTSVSGGEETISDTPRCNEEKAYCTEQCGGSQNANFQCQDSGTTFSKSCSCSMSDAYTYYYGIQLNQDYNYDYDYFEDYFSTEDEPYQEMDLVDQPTMSVEGQDEFPQEEKLEEEEEGGSISLNGYTTRDHIATATEAHHQRNQNQDTTDRCKQARENCQTQCDGLEMSFDCKDENGQFGQACSCEGGYEITAQQSEDQEASPKATADQD